MDDEVLRKSIRDRLRTGTLPSVNGRIVARDGTRSTCLVCNQPIETRQIEYVPNENDPPADPVTGGRYLSRAPGRTFASYRLPFTSSP